MSSPSSSADPGIWGSRTRLADYDRPVVICPVVICPVVIHPSRGDEFEAEVLDGVVVAGLQQFDRVIEIEG